MGTKQFCYVVTTTRIRSDEWMKLFEKCNGCDNRYAGCHSDCPDYLKDKATLNEMKADISTDDEYFGYVGDSLWRHRR